MSEPCDEITRRVLQRVAEHMGWDHAKAVLWLDTPNPNFGGLSAREFLILRPEKALRTIEFMIDLNSPPEEKRNVRL